MPIAVTMKPDGTYTWPTHIARQMADYIHAEVKDMVGCSRLIRKSDGILLTERHELQVGNLLGKGAFSEVHAVTYTDPKTGEKKSYAMKHLKFKLMSQPENFRLAAAELAVEAHMLASFDHPNVMKIRGWAANGVASFTQGGHDSFFLLLDQLDETLDQRIATWQEDESIRQHHRAQQQQHAQQHQNLVLDLWRRISNANNHSQPEYANEEEREHAERQQRIEEQREQALYLEKLGICTEIASALSYLHSRGVIFRDLKPNNIGFKGGRVQLFDFGLSRELPACDLTTPFEMSGKVGTLRYMAVEVACHQPYNVSADVYSWAMVSYEVLTLVKPFAGWTRDMHSNQVCGRGVRPDTASLQPAVRQLLTAGWSQHPHHRPTMAACMHRMQVLEEQELINLQRRQQAAYQHHQAAVHAYKQQHASSCSSQLQQQQTSQLYQMHQHIQQHYEQQQSAAVVELPHDFTLARKTPCRNVSGYTAGTVSLSMDSVTDYY